jgi:hypothetical protein
MRLLEPQGIDRLTGQALFAFTVTAVKHSGN